MKILTDSFELKNDEDRDTFRYRQYQTALMEEGDMIYRIYTPGHNHLIKTLADVVDPVKEQGTCWIDQTTYLRLFRVAGGSQYIQSFATRSLLAVKEEWNPAMSRLATAVVRTDFKAAYGLIKWQPLTKTNIILMGGGYQVFVLLKDADKLRIVSDTDIRPEANVATIVKP
jgi:hypothetical protein